MVSILNFVVVYIGWFIQVVFSLKRRKENCCKTLLKNGIFMHIFLNVEIKFDLFFHYSRPCTWLLELLHHNVCSTLLVIGNIVHVITCVNQSYGVHTLRIW